MANSEPFIVNAAIEPPRNVGIRNSERSNIGWLIRRSASTKTKSSTAPRQRQVMTAVLLQLLSPARISPYVRLTRPAVSTTKPAQSGRVAWGWRDSSTL